LVDAAILTIAYKQTPAAVKQRKWVDSKIISGLAAYVWKATTKKGRHHFSGKKCTP